MISEYRENSLTLAHAVAIGTGVMIGAGTLALTGQIAKLAAPFFRAALIAGALATAFSRTISRMKEVNRSPTPGNPPRAAR